MDVMNQESLADTLRKHVERLCVSERNVGFCPKGLREAEEFLHSELAAMGYAVSREVYEVDGVECANLEAVAPDFAGLKKPHVIVGAHYDSVPGTPGADDNASAVAILLEVARGMAESPCRKGLRFLAYTNEEPPYFYTEKMGSVVHAKGCQKRGDAIRGMVCLESLGIFSRETDSQMLPAEFDILPEEIKRMIVPEGIDPTVGNFLGVVGNAASAAFMREFCDHLANDAQLPVLATELLDIRLSDHLAYWALGYPAIMLTDTALYRNPNYHGEGDTPEKLDYGLMALLVERISKAIAGLG